MAQTHLPILILSLSLLLILSPFSHAHAEDSSLKLMTAEPLEWTAMYDDVEEEGEETTTIDPRRELFWRTMRYYISYGALSANRIPCPPRSGRSYYTHYCYKARGPAHPYTRGCSAITRCRR